VTPLQNTWEGVLSYALIKLIGYTLAALFLKRKYTTQTNVYLAGAFRTATGVGFGLAYTTMAEALWWRYEWRQFFSSD
jgi:hypothetical protein